MLYRYAICCMATSPHPGAHTKRAVRSPSVCTPYLSCTTMALLVHLPLLVSCCPALWTLLYAETGDRSTSAGCCMCAEGVGTGSCCCSTSVLASAPTISQLCSKGSAAVGIHGAAPPHFQPVTSCSSVHISFHVLFALSRKG